VKTVARHWTEGGGGEANPARKEAFLRLKTVASLSRAIEWIAKREKEPPIIIGTSAKKREGTFHWLEAKRKILREKKAVLFVFGTGSGLHDEALEQCSLILQPLSGGAEDYNHLSVRTAAGVIFDRFFGWR
ncbi:MAG: RNA methyltransferase, partial [Synergistaceae bacterium]|nr:RNA methyltransferase [Synergistaceae bacterium]